MQTIEITPKSMESNNTFSRIEIQCKYCLNKQEYTLRDSHKIPSRPKTQCTNPKCGKWIYIDKDLLVKKFGHIDKMTKEDQIESMKKSIKTIPKPKKTQITDSKPQFKMTKTDDQRPKENDQMTKIKTHPKSIKDNRDLLEVISIEQMKKEVVIFGRTIPLDKVREIARKTLENSRNLIKGMKYYQNAWEKRYKDYKKRKPNNFLIDEFESMQKTLDFLYEMMKINEELKNFKKGENSEL